MWSAGAVMALCASGGRRMMVLNPKRDENTGAHVSASFTATVCVRPQGWTMLAFTAHTVLAGKEGSGRSGGQGSQTASCFAGSSSTVSRPPCQRRTSAIQARTPKFVTSSFCVKRNASRAWPASSR